ncbi:MAG: hypothetical protein NVS1B10_08930 [Candidatus Saccharimonadales bacterium]
MSNEVDCEVVPVTILGKTENYCRTHKKDVKGKSCPPVKTLGEQAAEKINLVSPKLSWPADYYFTVDPTTGFSGHSGTDSK